MKSTTVFILAFVGVAWTSYGQSWHALGDGLNGNVLTLVGHEGDLYVGGFFGAAGGHPDADYLAKWTGEAWEPVAPGLRGPVHAIAFDGDDLYVGGAFPAIQGVPNTQHLARWDGATWHAVGDGLNAVVQAITVMEGAIYAGGAFTDAGGVDSADYVARWAGGVWQALGGGIPGTGFRVNTLATKGDSLLVGGNFVNVNDVPNTQGIAIWANDQWHSLGGGFWADMGVLSIIVTGSDIYAGGDGGTYTPPTCGIARWDGTAWHSLGTGLSNCLYGEGAYAIATAGQDVYVGGLFDHTGNVNDTECLSRWNGAQWNALGNPDLDPYDIFDPEYISAISSDGNEVYIGGAFEEIAEVAGTRNIALWRNPVTAVDDRPGLKNGPAFLVSPNPAHDRICVRPTLPGDVRLECRMFNGLGQLVRQQRFLEGEINLADLPTGPYFLHVRTADRSEMIRIVKQ